MWTKKDMDDNHIRYQKELDGDKGNELLVGTDDGQSVSYVALFWTPRGDSFRRLNQYFFRNDEPSAFNFGMMSGPGWPSNRPALNSAFRPHFNDLGEQVPSLKESLDACVEQLEKPGESYELGEVGVVKLEV